MFSQPHHGVHWKWHVHRCSTTCSPPLYALPTQSYAPPKSGSSFCRTLLEWSACGTVFRNLSIHPYFLVVIVIGRYAVYLISFVIAFLLVSHHCKFHFMTSGSIATTHDCTAVCRCLCLEAHVFCNSGSLYIDMVSSFRPVHVWNSLLDISSTPLIA